MSLGNGYDNNTGRNNGNNNEREPYMYPVVKFKNPGSKVDPTCLQYQYLYGLLNVSISPKKEGGADYTRYDHDKKVQIWLSYGHAQMLLKEIERLMEVNNKEELFSVSVAVKDTTIITFSYGDKYGSNNYVLSIATVSADGQIQSSYAYEFPDDRYSSIINFDPTTKNYKRNQLHNVEVDMFLTVLQQYINASTGANAYFNRYYSRYDDNRQYNMLASISEKLGVQTRGRYSRNNNEGGFFSNGNNGSMSGNGNTGTSFNTRSLPNDEYEEDQYE